MGPIWHAGCVARPRKSEPSPAAPDAAPPPKRTHGGARRGAGGPRKEEPTPTLLGQRLTRLREAAVPPLTMTELARLAAVTPPTVFQIESGRNKTPSVETLAAFVRVLAPRLPLGEIPPNSDAARVLGYILGL